MRDRITEMAADTQVIVVTFTDPAKARDYQNSNDLPFTILVDPDRSTYRTYGLDEGRVSKVWGWSTLRKYLQIFAKKGLGDLRPATENTLQLGGDFVIAPDGTLAYGYWSQGPADRPGAGILLAAVETARTA